MVLSVKFTEPVEVRNRSIRFYKFPFLKPVELVIFDENVNSL